MSGSVDVQLMYSIPMWHNRNHLIPGPCIFGLLHASVGVTPSWRWYRYRHGRLVCWMRVIFKINLVPFCRIDHPKTTQQGQPCATGFFFLNERLYPSRLLKWYLSRHTSCFSIKRENCRSILNLKPQYISILLAWKRMSELLCLHLHGSIVLISVYVNKNLCNIELFR